VISCDGRWFAAEHFVRPCFRDQTHVMHVRVQLHPIYRPLFFSRFTIYYSRVMHSTVTAKGQITIPVAIRRKLGMKNGTRIHVEVDQDANEIILKPITREYIHSLRGSFHGKGLLKALMTEKRSERKRMKA
jgi:AbrB family looped-hinge helix DNA binding protein